MTGLLKTKPAGTQFLILICIALASFFIIGLFGTMLLYEISGMGFDIISDTTKWDYNDGRTVVVIRGMLIIQFVSLFLIPAFLCARFFSTDSKKYIGLKKPTNSFYFLAGAAIMLLAIPLAGSLGELNSHVQFPSGIEKWMKSQEEQASKSIKALLDNHTLKDLVLNVVCIAGLAAVGEELLFRGVVQRLLVKLFKSPWAGIIVSAFLFSAMHVQFYGFLPRFMLGILLGVVYWYSGSLWTAILAHFVYDAFFVVLVYFKPETLNDEYVFKFLNPFLIAAISFVLVVLLIAWMNKKSTVTYHEVYADDLIPVKDHPF